MRNLTRGIVMRTEPPKPGEDWFRIENKKGEDTTHVYIYDEIGYWGTTAADFAKELAAVDTKKIHLHINSPGGEVFDGVAIYNAIYNHKAETTSYVDALAASAASFIATAADKVVIAKNGTLMIHDAMGLAFGNAADMKEMFGMLNRISDTIAEMYQAQGGGEVKDWRALMRKETWYNASEALDAGLVDEVASKEDADAEKATDKWDLSIFNYAGRTNAPSPLMQRMLIGNNTEAEMGQQATEQPDEGQQQQQNPDDGQQQEGQQPAQATGEGEGAEAQPDGTGTEQAPPPPGNQPASPPEPENRAGQQPLGVLINGQRVTDPAAIQAALDAGAQFRTETIQQARIDFVENLARQNKISAAQIGNKAEGDKPASGLIKFALNLSDEQFTDWSASFESAPTASLFGQHGSTPANSGRPGNGGEPDETADRIVVLEAIVADHRRTGATEEQLKTKPSYIELQDLKAKQQAQQ